MYSHQHFAFTLPHGRYIWDIETTLNHPLSLSNLILELSTPLFTRTRVEVSFLIVFFFGTSLVLYFFDICFLKSHYDFFFASTFLRCLLFAEKARLSLSACGSPPAPVHYRFSLCSPNVWRSGVNSSSILPPSALWGQRGAVRLLFKESFVSDCVITSQSARVSSICRSGRSFTPPNELEWN